ncbi:hypothetical protein DDE74_12040 [Streptomyces lydicus]|uniref:Transposase n=1 Tax=Streptomyces lydicus TaxID=47763 RepID=A0A3S9Y9E3_9ACTN|nr:hypothetical protein DDE74_12040 [Streptomyces lydicus]
MIDAIAWKFQTGSQWVHLPGRYGDWREQDTEPRSTPPRRELTC